MKVSSARYRARRYASARCPGRSTRADSFANPGGRRALDRLARRLCGRRAAEAVGVHAVLAVETTVRWLALARAVTVARLRRRGAVMDRYTHCQHANLIARQTRGTRLVRLPYAVFPRPDVVVLLDLPPRQAHQRIGRRGTDDEDLHYLITTDRAYRALPEATDFVIVDVSQSPRQVAAALRVAVADHLSGRHPLNVEGMPVCHRSPSGSRSSLPVHADNA